MPFRYWSAVAGQLVVVALIASAAISALPAAAMAAERSSEEWSNSETVADPDPESAEGDFEERAQTIQQWLKKRELERIGMGLSHQYERARSVHDIDNEEDSDPDSEYGGYRQAGHGLFVKLRRPSYQLRHERYSGKSGRYHSRKASTHFSVIRGSRIRQKSGLRGLSSGAHQARADSRSKQTSSPSVVHGRGVTHGQADKVKQRKTDVNNALQPRLKKKNRAH